MEPKAEPAQAVIVTQDTLPLPIFGAEVPLLHTPEGDYVPIRALCEMLGLRPATWIGVVCSQHKGRTNAVRRWPYRAPDGTTRPEWCLEQHDALRWLSYLWPEKLQGERREQLLAYQQTMMDAMGQAYEQMQSSYQALRRTAFSELSSCQGMQATLTQLDEQLSPHLAHTDPPIGGEAAVGEFRALLARGHETYDAYAAVLREVLAEMTGQPVIDALIVDDQGQVIDTQAMPILPVAPDTTAMIACQERVRTWLGDLKTWLTGHGFEVRGIE